MKPLGCKASHRLAFFLPCFINVKYTLYPHKVSKPQLIAMAYCRKSKIKIE